MRWLRSRATARLRWAMGAGQPPSRIAAAWALGLAISFSPLLGLHTVIALGLALAFRLNKVDVLLGTLVVNPWTLPVYFPVAVLLGRRLTGVRVPRVEVPRLSQLVDLDFWRAQAGWLKPLMISWGVGACAVAVVVGAVTFVSLRWWIERRRRGLAGPEPMAIYEDDRRSS